MNYPYDAILIMSFGGPEGMDDVMPFLENVLRGKNVPEERKKEVAHHYELFGGVSPINKQTRDLKAAIEEQMKREGIDLPVYLGNRNWHPYVTDVVREMQEAGVKKFLTFVTSGFSCYSGCRQYRENVTEACDALGEGKPSYHKIRVYYNHPDFIAVSADHWRQALEKFPEDRRAAVHTAFTAHSIPDGMAKNSDYEIQLRTACELTAEAAGITDWKLVFQSRSGPPQMPWLEPDICDHIEELHRQGVKELIIHPIGFISDHMEVLFDLDEEAHELCEKIGMNMVRAATPGLHPTFVSMIVELIRERLDPSVPKRALGSRGPNHDVCPGDCCLPGARPAMRPAGTGHPGA